MCDLYEKQLRKHVEKYLEYLEIPTLDHRQLILEAFDIPKEDQDYWFINVFLPAYWEYVDKKGYLRSSARMFDKLEIEI